MHMCMCVYGYICVAALLLFCLAPSHLAPCGVGVCSRRLRRPRCWQRVRHTQSDRSLGRSADPSVCPRRRRRRMCPCCKLIVKIMMILAPTTAFNWSNEFFFRFFFFLYSVACAYLSLRCRCLHFIRSLILYRLEARIKTQKRQPGLFFPISSFFTFLQLYESRYSEREKSLWRVKSFGFIRTLNVQRSTLLSLDKLACSTARNEPAPLPQPQPCACACACA